MKRTTAIATMLSLSLILGASAFPTANIYAANTKNATKQQNTSKQTKPAAKPTPVHTLSELKPIRLTAKSAVKLTDVNMYKQDESNILTYTLTYYNNDQRSLPLIDYWTKVRTKGGTVYSSVLTTKDKEKKTVPGLSEMSVTYYAKVAKGLTINDLFFDIIKWDFSKAGFENRLGSFQIPTWMTASTVVGKSSTVRMNDIPIKTSIDRVTSMLNEDMNYVNVAVNVENLGFKALENPTYKYVIKTASGSSYPLVPDSASKEYKLQPSEKKTLNFMTAIPKSVVIKNLELQLLTEDETAKINLPVATLKLPASNAATSVIPANKEQVITIDKAKVSTKILNGWANQSFEENDITLTFQFENLSNRPVTIPKYEFVLKGPNGLSVPIPTKSLDNLTLKAMEKRPITLSAIVSTDVPLEQLKLQLNKPGDSEQKDPTKPETNQKDSNFKFPEGTYKLPDLQSMRNQTGIEYDVQHSKGNLGITIESLQRLPWLDGDVLSAKLKIKNKETKTIQLPALEGVFKLDTSGVSGKTQVISSNGALIIGAREVVDVYIITKVPSYMDFSQVQTALMEKIGETDSAPIIQFTNGGKLSKLPVVEFGKVYNLTTQGRKADIEVKNSKVYEGAVEQIIYTDLVMKSQEERQTILSQMVAYYRSDDGRYYKANLSQVQGPTSPQGLNVVTAWVKVPKTVNKTDLQLIIGEGITENKLTPPKGESDGYINAVAMDLKVVQPTVQRDFVNLDLFPYSLTLYNFYVTANRSSNLSIEFSYDMARQLEYNMGDYGHKLVIEIVDSSGKRFEKEIDFVKEFTEGKNKSFSTSISDAFFEKIENGGFQLTLYDVFDKEKIKLASHGSAYNIRNAKTAD